MKDWHVNCPLGKKPSAVKEETGVGLWTAVKASLDAGMVLEVEEWAIAFD